MTENEPQDQKSGLSTLTIVLIAGFSLVALAFIFSNFETADFNFLNLEVRMPEWLLFIVLFGLGFGTGWAVSAARTRKLRKAVKDSLD